MYYQTEQRRRLSELLKSHIHEQLSVKEIADELADTGISISAIYRNLAKLVRDGVVRKSIRSSSREATYQYIADDGCRGAIHLMCTECGRSYHMDRILARQMQRGLARADGFRIDTSKIVLYGICRMCSE